MKPFQLFTIFYIILFASCEKSISFDLPNDRVIVVNSIISPSGPVQVQLSKSISITEKDTIKYLNNAIIEIYCDNAIIEKINCLGDGLYKSSFIPETGREYKIKVSSVDYSSTITAQTIIPPKPEIISSYADTNNINGFNIRVHITINDDASVKNYYYLSLKGYNIEIKQDSCIVDSIVNGYTFFNCKQYKVETFSKLMFINNDYVLTSNDNSTAKETLNAITGNAEVGNDIIEWLAFSDQAINGTKHTIELHIVNTIMSGPSKPIYIELKSINEDYFKYLQSKKYAENSGNNPFSEPVQVYNNIKGGAGLFAAYNLAIDSITTIRTR